MPRHGSDLTPEISAEIRRLWVRSQPRLSATQIGVLVGGMAKGKVLRHVHDLGLPPRPSPVSAHTVRYTPEEKAALVRMAGQGFAPEEIAARLGRTPGSIIRKCFASGITLTCRRVSRRGRPPGRATAAPSAPPRPAPVTLAENPCCYPLGEPRTPSFRMCDTPAMRGKSYCQTHYDLTHQTEEPDHEAE